MAEDRWVTVGAEAEEPQAAPLAPDIPAESVAPEPTMTGTVQSAVDQWVPAKLQLSDAPTNRQGAPAVWRVLVSLAESPEDQVSTLRDLQKKAGVPEDAEWVNFGGRKGGERLVGGIPRQEKPIEGQTMLVYTDPQTGQRQAFDPKGFSMEDITGDLADAGMDISRVIAAGITSIFGGSVGGPAGAYAGAVAGSQAVKYAAEPIVEALTGVDVPDTREISEQLLEGGMDVGLEAALPAVGGLVAKTAVKAARAPLRQRAWKPKGMGKPEVLEDIEGMAVEQGLDPTRAIRGAAPLVTESTTVRGFFEGLKNYPRAAEVVQSRVNETLGVVRNAFTKAHVGLGGTTSKATAGEMAQQGIQKWAAGKAVAQENLESQLEQIIGKNTQVRATGTANFIRQKLADAEGMKASSAMVVPVEYRKILKDITDGGGSVPFGAFRAVRRSVGGKGAKGDPFPGHASAEEMDALYAVMSQDMATAAKGSGKAASETWSAAMKNWTQRQEKVKKLRGVINAKEPEMAFKNAVSGAKDGPTRLSELKGTLNDEEWETLTSVKLWDMATTSSTVGARGEMAQVFSPTQFIRNWRQTPSSVKSVLFGDKSKVRTELDRLARVSAAEEGAQGAINVSGTARGNVFMEAIGQGGLGGVTGHSLAAQAGVMRATAIGVKRLVGMSPKAQARLMTDPDFVRWLADGSKKLSADPARLGPITAEHLGRLSGIAVAKPGIAPEIEEYLTLWQDATQPAQEATR